MTALLRRLAADETGSLTAEAAVLVPVVAMAAGLLWAWGLTALADSTVLHAAIDAARVASMQPTAADAQQHATAVAREVLSDRHLHCHSVAVAVDTSGFAVPVGQPAQVAVDVTCQINLADLYLPGLDGEKILHEHWVSPLDTFRTRT
jgi:Flp pilus assembly protein TadG